MKKASQIRFLLLVVAVTVCAGSALAQDWPQWRGIHRDGKVEDFTAPAAWPGQLAEKWRVTVGAGDATPALVGDKLYVFARQGGDEVTLCLDAQTGKELWKDSYAASEVSGPAGRHPGPRSSPAVADGKVVTLGVAGVLSCLDAETGKMLWRKDPYSGVVPQFFTSSSPIIADGMVVTQLGGPGNGAIMACDLATGEEKWKWDGEGPEYASPVMLEADGVKQIVTLTEKSIVGVTLADGKLLWQLPFVPERRSYNAATPIVDGLTVIYTGAGRGTFAVKIEKTGERFAAKEIWSNPDVATQYNTPVLHEGMLYGVSNEGKLFCLNAQTGQTEWMDETQRDRGGFATLVDTGSVLLALPSSAEMIVYAPSGEKYEERAVIKVSDTSIYSYPVVTGNCLYIKDQETVALQTIE